MAASGEYASRMDELRVEHWRPFEKAGRMAGFEIPWDDYKRASELVGKGLVYGEQTYIVKLLTPPSRISHLFAEPTDLGFSPSVQVKPPE